MVWHCSAIPKNPRFQLLNFLLQRPRSRRPHSRATLETIPNSLPKPYSSFITNTPISMDGHLGVATKQLRRWQTPRSISIDESPTDYVSPHTYYSRPISSSPLFWTNNFFSTRSYDFVFCVPLDDFDDGGTYTKWYTVNIRADGSGKVFPKEIPLTSFWEGKLPVIEGFAVLGSPSHVYRFGGLTSSVSPSDVCKLHVNHSGASWEPVCPMISRRLESRSLVLDGKIYVFSVPNDFVEQAIPPIVRWGEVFDPVDGQWESLPDTPYDSSCTLISAALENPSRILVAFNASSTGSEFTGYSAMFCTYNVEYRCWEMLAPAERKLHPNYPVGSLQRTVVVHNTLYWVTHVANEIRLLAYDLDLDTWAEGHLKGLGILLFDADESCYMPPCLLHLEKHRFCLFQTLCKGTCLAPDGYLHCVAVDISHMPGENRLGISPAWERIHKIDCFCEISDCLLLPEIKQAELRGAN